MIDRNLSRLSVILCLGLGCLVGCASRIPAGPAQEIQWRMTPDLTADAIHKNNEIRLILWRAVQSGTGTVTAKKRVTTVEGDPVVYYLTVRDGVIEFVQDYREDPFGPPGVVRDRVHQLHIGHLDAEKVFHQSPDAPDGAELVIRFTLPGRGDWYF